MLKTLQAGKASSWSAGSVASPAAIPHSRSFKRPYSLSDPGVDWNLLYTGAFE